MMSTPDALLLVAVCAAMLGFVLVCTTGGFPAGLARRVVRRMKVALRGSQAAKTAPTTSRRELETSSFEAYTHCGGCGKLDYHPMREPHRELEDHEFRLAWQHDYCRSILLGETRKGIPFYLEHTFDVIRECSCGHSWGQR